MGHYHPIRSTFKVFNLVVINLLVLLVLLESASLGFYFLKTRAFFYPRNKERIQAAASEFAIAPQPDREGEAVGYQLHPYFGFIFPPAYADLPFKKTSKDQFVIGIFGGSMAHYFYKDSRINHPRWRANAQKQ